MISDRFKYDKSVFAVRLKELMHTNRTTRQFLADILHVKSQSISAYTSGIVMAGVDKIFAIAKFYNVSTDYLLGLTDCKSPNLELKKIDDITGLNAETIMKLVELKKSNPEVLKVLIQLITSADQNNKTILDLIFNFCKSDSMHMKDGNIDVLNTEVKDCVFLHVICNYLKKFKEDYRSEINRVEKKPDETKRRK